MDFTVLTTPSGKRGSNSAVGESALKKARLDDADTTMNAQQRPERCGITAGELGVPGWFTRERCTAIAQQRSVRCCTTAVQSGGVRRVGGVGAGNTPIIPWLDTLRLSPQQSSTALCGVERALSKLRNFDLVTNAKSPELVRFLTLYRGVSGAATTVMMSVLSRSMFIGIFKALGDDGTVMLLFEDDAVLKCSLNALSFSLEFALGPTQLPHLDRGFTGWGHAGGAYPLTRMLLFEFAKCLRHFIIMGSDGVGNVLREQLMSVLTLLKHALCVP